MSNSKGLDICVDFDGTCTAHDFPRVGHDIGAVPVLKELVAKGHRLILFTMRSDIDSVDTTDDPDLHPEAGDYLTQAVNWFKENNIELYGIQENPTQKKWTASPKAYGHLYIDDAALGIPLIYPADRKRPYVDWGRIRDLLTERGIL